MNQPSQPHLASSPHQRGDGKGLAWVEIGILLVALVLRTVLLDIKPAHFDEGVNGWFADQMTRLGYFRYEPTNYHGPLHFYAVFLSQTLFGRNLWALRLPAIISSVLAVWALLRYREFFGATTVRIAALVMALSPACVFYGRYSIHESWMMLFQITFLWGVLGLWQKGERRFFFTTVFAAVGMILTKETYILHFGCFLLAGAVLWAWGKLVPSHPSLPTAKRQWTGRDAAWAGGLSLLTIVFFYSANFFDFSTLKGLYQTFGTWFDTGFKLTGHEKSSYTLWGIEALNYYWVMLLARYEWPALLGLAACFRFVLPSDARLRYTAIYAGGVLLAYSLIPYKSPWCLLSIGWPFFLLFGAVVDEACRRFGTLRLPLLAGTMLPVLVSLGVSLRLNFFHFDDPKEPYVYVQTFREVRILTDPLLGMAKRDPRYYHVSGLLLLDSSFPLPWILGDFTRLGYLAASQQPAGPLTQDCVVIEKKDTIKVENALVGNYFKRDFRLRDAQGDCVVYFRQGAFKEWFHGEKAEIFATSIQNQEITNP